MEGTIAALKEQVRTSWYGETGEHRAQALEAFVRELLAEYAPAFGVRQAELLAALERSRTGLATGFYQRTNFPRLEEVTLLANMREFKKRYPSGCFRCPSCGGVSTNPSRCNSGLETGEGDSRRTCNWRPRRAGQPGSSMRVAFREGFLEKPSVFEILPPIELEGPVDGKPPAWPT